MLWAVYHHERKKFLYKRLIDTRMMQKIFFIKYFVFSRRKNAVSWWGKYAWSCVGRRSSASMGWSRDWRP